MRFDTILSLVAVLTPLALARPWVDGDECPTIIEAIISSDPCQGSGTERCTKEPQFSSMDSVHAVLSSCPNITKLDLRVTGLGCSEWPDRWNFPLNPAGGEKYPPLKSLRLEGYHFGKPPVGVQEAWEFPKPRYYPQWDDAWYWWMPDGGWTGRMANWLGDGQWRTWMQRRALPRPQMEKSNFGLWLDAMDWSSIEEIMIDRLTDEVLEKLPARLFSLKKLETTNVSFIDALPNHTLTHLKWVGNIEGVNLSNILNQQGKSLQSLEFRHNELESSIFTSGFDISVLPKMARNLTHVGINIPRNGTWPLESLKTVASLPHLKSADLWMNLQSECRRQKPNGHDRIQRDWEREHGRDVCKDEEQFQQPFVGKEGAEGIFAYMKEHNRVGELEDVTFWVGDWARPWDGPLYFPVWGEGKSSKVECTSAGLKTDDTDGKCVVERGEKYWNWWDEMPQEFYDGMGEWW